MESPNDQLYYLLAISMSSYTTSARQLFIFVYILLSYTVLSHLLAHDEEGEPRGVGRLLIEGDAHVAQRALQLLHLQ